MNDHQLGYWALDHAKKCLSLRTANQKFSSLRGAQRRRNLQQVSLCENTEVTKLNTQVNLTLADGTTQTFDKIINIAGPWAEQLLKQTNIKPNYTLDLVRGSHIVIEQKLNHGYFLEIPNELRIFFVLSYQGKTLIGTTEQRQTLNDNITQSEQESYYLINAHNHYFKTPISKQNILQSFAGMRPLIKSADNPNKATRKYAVQQNLITVFGGKWTTARLLSLKVAGLVK